MLVTTAARSQGKYCPHFDMICSRLDNGSGIAQVQIRPYFDRRQTSLFNHSRPASLLV
jgi:hypothetical protein